MFGDTLFNVRGGVPGSAGHVEFAALPLSHSCLQNGAGFPLTGGGVVEKDVFHRFTFFRNYYGSTEKLSAASIMPRK